MRKEQSIRLFNWQLNIDSDSVTSLGEDLILLDNPSLESYLYTPFKVDTTTAIVCFSGKSEGFINLKPYTIEASSFTIILPGKIVEYNRISDDFDAVFIIMSKNFISSLHIQTQSSLFYSIYDNPSVHLSEKGLSSITRFYSMLKEVIQTTDNPYRLETAMYLTKAFFYGTSYSFHREKEDLDKSKQEIVVDRFLDLVKKTYKKERSISFYADKLNMTPKYLSYLVKINSGQSANEWINQYVILEAKALLKSTNMTVQQISDELTFSSQSFFGKYFKRITGLSPKDYKATTTNAEYQNKMNVTK